MATTTAAPLPDGKSAVVVAGDHIVVAGPGRAALVEECQECSGVAVAGDIVVTTRAQGEGFEILRFGLDLTPQPVVKAERLAGKLLKNSSVSCTLGQSAVSPDGVDPWFELTDLRWAENKVTATGFVHAPPAGDTSNGCDSPPTTWQRTVDPAAGAPDDVQAQVSYAASRWVGPDCRDTVEILRNLQGGGDLTMEKSGELLGSYDRLRFGQPSPTTCPA